MSRVLDRLEEWLIATLIAAATGLIFLAVLHRYGTGVSIDAVYEASLGIEPHIGHALPSRYVRARAATSARAKE